MDYDALARLGGGCTDTPERGFNGKEGGGRFVCPTLDFYRRAVGNPVREEIAA